MLIEVRATIIVRVMMTLVFVFVFFFLSLLGARTQSGRHTITGNFLLL